MTAAPVAVVIPAYDASATLGAVIDATRASLCDASIVVVDDGSRDATSTIARERGVTVHRFHANRGKGAALKDGFAIAMKLGAHRIVTLDADAQHDPSFAPALVAALDDADVAIGARARDGRMPMRRRVTNGLSSRAVSRIIGADVADAQSGYRAFRSELLARLDATSELYGDRYEYESELLIAAGRAGARIAVVPVPTVYGAESHFRGVRDTARVVHAIWRARGDAIREQP